MHELDTAVTLRPTPDSPGAFRAELDAGWRIGGGLNGGYLLAVVANAARQVVGERHPDPLSLSAYYQSASVPGPASLETDVVREGGSISTVSVSLRQDGGERIRALASMTDLGELPDDVATTAAPPELPPLEQCVGTEGSPPQLLASAAMLERMDLRLDPACVGWAAGQPSGRGLMQGWFRFADGREPDPIALLFVVDALPPVTFDLGLPGWAPTVELTAHVRARPAPGWLRVVHSTRNHAGGLLEEDAEVWDSAGRLVAQSRQLARAPRPISPASTEPGATPPAGPDR